MLDKITYCLKNQLRWNSVKGLLNVEDLFELSFDDLDLLYRELSLELSNLGGESLKTETSESKEINELSIKRDVVKYVFEDKEATSMRRKLAQDKLAKKQRLLSIIHAKEDEALANKTLDELQEMINELE